MGAKYNHVPNRVIEMTWLCIGRKRKLLLHAMRAPAHVTMCPLPTCTSPLSNNGVTVSDAACVWPLIKLSVVVVGYSHLV